MSTSLESAIKTLKVNVGAAPRLESERTIGTGEFKMCPRWVGNDTVGRYVNPDSYYTKSPGCNSAIDRVLVENQVSRPRYYTYIALNTKGLNGDLYDETQFVEPYHRQFGFGTSINSAISSTIPEDRLLRAEEIYLKSNL